LVLPDPPLGLPADAERGVKAALRRSGASCLVSALVRQRWEVAHGRRRDLVVGVTGPVEFRAHAWLEGDRVPRPGEADEIPASELDLVDGAPSANGLAPEGDDLGERRFHELLRRPAPR
jgi:hypothetical protein